MIYTPELQDEQRFNDQQKNGQRLFQEKFVFLGAGESPPSSTKWCYSSKSTFSIELRALAIVLGRGHQDVFEIAKIALPASSNVEQSVLTAEVMTYGSNTAMHRFDKNAASVN